MRLVDIKTKVRKLLQDDQYDGDLIRDAANYVVYDLFNNTKTRLMEESDTITALAGATAADFPSDMMNWISIYATKPQVFEITDNYMQYSEFMQRHAGFATASSGRVGDWTDFGNGMRFAQPLSVSHTFQIDYVREPIPMERDNDECELPDRYEELLLKGTKARIMEIDEDYAEGDQERALLEPLVTAFIRNEARGGGKTKPTVIRTRRGRRYSDRAVHRLGD